MHLLILKKNNFFSLCLIGAQRFQNLASGQTKEKLLRVLIRHFTVVYQVFTVLLYQKNILPLPTVTNQKYVNMEKGNYRNSLESFLKNDELTISVGKQTERFIKLYLATCRLASAIGDELEAVYGTHQRDELYEETFDEHISEVLSGLRRYIGASIVEQMMHSMNVTDNQINI